MNTKDYIQFLEVFPYELNNYPDWEILFPITKNFKSSYTNYITTNNSSGNSFTIPDNNYETHILIGKRIDSKYDIELENRRLRAGAVDRIVEAIRKLGDE